MEVSNNNQVDSVIYKIGALKNMAKFKGKHQHWSLCLNEVQGLLHKSLLKKRLQDRCFRDNLAKRFRAIV